MSACAAKAQKAQGAVEKRAPAAAATTPAAEYPSAGTHPRLFLRAADLPSLRARAVATNPFYHDALGPIGERAKADMDGGKVPAAGDCLNGVEYCESYAELFAFLSLVENDPAVRRDYARRARQLLMHMVERVLAAKHGDPLAGVDLPIGNRSRWFGESFALTVDWIYGALSPTDRAAVRRLFLRWAEALLHAEVTGPDHPEPVGLLADPRLLADRNRRRFSLNNYFAAHARNLGLMALVIDAADDEPALPASEATYPRLRDYLKNVTGAWLYMADHVMRNEARGGASPEGPQYGPQTLAYWLQLHLALATAGEDDATRWGPQVDYGANPFWRELVPAFLHAQSPRPVIHEAWQGPMSQFAWHGDGQVYETGDAIDLFAPFALLARRRGDLAGDEQARWIQTALMPGGAEKLLYRAANTGFTYRTPIFYFLLFDPALPTAADPRPKLPLLHLGEGLGEVLARTGWGPDASWFQFRIGWHSIDHTHGDGLDFGLWRHGEWLTKERTGYSEHFECSDQHNTLAVENARPFHFRDLRRGGFWKRGSQYVLTHRGDGRLVASGAGAGWVYALGDATELYNSDYEQVNEVAEVSRAIVWLQPDWIVIHDRAATTVDGRFKRFHLQTPATPRVEGHLATVETPGKQRLFVTTLLPADAQLSAAAYPEGGEWDTKLVQRESMRGTLRVEAKESGREVSFLHVLEAADGGKAPSPTRLLEVVGASGATGALVHDTLVLFARRGARFASLACHAPPSARRLLVTGLDPGGQYDLTRRGDGDGVEWTLRPGASKRADNSGVLDLDLAKSGPKPRP